MVKHPKHIHISSIKKKCFPPQHITAQAVLISGEDLSFVLMNYGSIDLAPFRVQVRTMINKVIKYVLF